MNDPVDLLASYPDLSNEEMEELRRAVAADRKLAVVIGARERIRTSIESPLQERRLFSLFALHRSGRAGELSHEEIELVGRYSDEFEASLAEYPGLAVAADDIAEAASEFSDLWDVHFEGTEERPLRRERPPVLRSSRSSPYRWAVRGAIAVAIVAFAVIVSQVVERDRGMLTVQTAEGETQVVELGDGSRVRVFASSTLSYSHPQSTLRRAELSGRAFFEIASEGRGFIVETPTARATVLGTSFGVDAQHRLTEVVLTEGRLTLARSDKLDDLVVLEPGQMSRVVAGSGPSAPVEVDVPRRLNWTGLFIFQSTPLSEIAALLGRHFSVAIDVDEGLKDERVTGTFEQNQPLRDILEVVAAAVGAHVEPNAAGGFELMRS